MEREAEVIPRSALETLSQVWQLLPAMDTPLGALVQAMQEPEVPPDDKTKQARGADLLPVSISVVDKSSLSRLSRWLKMH